MAVNTFVPAGLSNTRAYNWSRSAYSATSSPQVVTDPNVPRQTAAYEWLDSAPAGSTTRWFTNPPFLSSEAGRLLTGQRALDSAGNQVPARILRGFIRRAQVNVADHPSQCRLYFMYNPAEIVRDYVSYLDQGALDPFNTVYQSGNLVAPPSFMDFSFELFFDRQAEAASADHPGVMVDQEYFDLVVRNVIPGDDTSGGLPDNGLLMVNPKDITVVFSPQLSVQGRPTSAKIIYEKFTHRMTPTRMRIGLTMRVVYFGPVRDITNYTTEEPNVQLRVPFDIPEPAAYDFKFEPLTWNSNGQDVDPSTLINATSDGLDGAGTNGGAPGLERALKATNVGATCQYSLTKRSQLWDFADCSSLVWGSLVENNDAVADRLGWPQFSTHSGGPSVDGMFTTFTTKKYNNSAVALMIYGGGLPAGVTSSTEVFDLIMKNCERGDILMRHNHPDKPQTATTSGDHIAYFADKDHSGDSFRAFHASGTNDGVRYTKYTRSSTITYNYAFRLTFGTTEEDQTNPTETDGRRPDAPKGVTAVQTAWDDDADTGTVKITWKTPTSWGSRGTPLGFYVQKKSHQHTDGVWKESSFIAGRDVTEYSWSGLERNTSSNPDRNQWVFRVFAESSIGRSNGAGEAKVTVRIL